MSDRLSTDRAMPVHDLQCTDHTKASMAAFKKYYLRTAVVANETELL
jgi:hypothetical protein